ncbi:MAG: hypothetical protein LBP90_05470 [Burkholderiales bacterium]|jgi:hypothetical protein|nr:hypothetical protein [Burkholderiales bacterium]
MSHSRRNTPIVGFTTCRSERDDKKCWHKRWRTCERIKLASASSEALDDHQTLIVNQVSNVCSMGKDGRQYWSVKSRMDTAVFMANRKGRNDAERAALKLRMLRKWMSK